MNSACGAAAALLFLLAAGCSRPLAEGSSGDPAVDLRPLLAPDTETSAGGRHHSRFEVTRNGRRVESTVLVAPAAVRASLAGIEGPWMLELLMAPVFNLGDGFQMEILLVLPGGNRSLYSRYCDPGRRASDRAWLRVAQPVDLKSGDGRSVEIRVSAGPQGDLVDDWLALGSVRLASGAH
jgi:hypothetical protein